MIIWSCTIVLSFFVYSFLGWLWESTVCSLHNEKQLINRGFLVGPLCPIYGAGALCCYFALYHVQNPVAVFVLSASFVLCIGIPCSRIRWKRYFIRDGGIIVISHFFKWADLSVRCAGIWNWVLFREVFCAAGAVSFIFLYGTRGLSW